MKTHYDNTTREEQHKRKQSDVTMNYIILISVMDVNHFFHSLKPSMINTGFSWIRVAQTLVFSVVFCELIIVFLSYSLNALSVYVFECPFGIFCF